MIHIIIFNKETVYAFITFTYLCLSYNIFFSKQVAKQQKEIFACLDQNELMLASCD